MTVENEKVADDTIDLQGELVETHRELREITLMIEQSQSEMAKLSRRNAAITTHLQQIQSKMEQTPPQEIRMVYESALDAQQRLFIMHGQLAKLQSDKNHLEKYKLLLDQVTTPLGAASISDLITVKDPLAAIEMVVNAQEAERQRLSRQMHDGPAQAMSNFILQTEIAMRLLDVDVSQAKEELGSLKSAAMATFQNVRNFIFELRPMMLDDLGLTPTIRKYIDAFKEQSSSEVTLTVKGTERRLEPYLEVMIFRAVQELLGNASRHSQATVVKVNIDMGVDQVRVSVDDNGKGFDPAVIRSSYSLGLKLIKERVELLGGSFQVDSAFRKGARIAFSVPAHE